MTQLTLPEIVDIPSWVYAALDNHSYRTACKPGLFGFIADYPELSICSERVKFVEETVFWNLRRVALAWQAANFRTYLTPVEYHVMMIERVVMQSPLSMGITSSGTRYIKHNYVAEEIQKRLATGQGKRGGIIITKHQVREALRNIDAIMVVSETEGFEVEIRLQTALQKVA